MEFNPFLPELRENPYPLYSELRAHDPIHRSSLGMWFISRYADADALLRDRRLGRDFSRFLDAQIGPKLYLFAQARWDKGFDPGTVESRLEADEYAASRTASSDSSTPPSAPPTVPSNVTNHASVA